MSNQKRTIIGACDYSIATMQNLKRDLQDISANNSELNWAIGGLVATLVCNLIKICDHVFKEATASGDPNAKQDLTDIKERFAGMVEQMVNHE